MKKLILDFLYYFKRGYGLKRSWQRAKVTL